MKRFLHRWLFTTFAWLAVILAFSRVSQVSHLFELSDVRAGGFVGFMWALYLAILATVYIAMVLTVEPLEAEFDEADSAWARLMRFAVPPALLVAILAGLASLPADSPISVAAVPEGWRALGVFGLMLVLHVICDWLVNDRTPRWPSQAIRSCYLRDRRLADKCMVFVTGPMARVGQMIQDNGWIFAIFLLAGFGASVFLAAWSSPPAYSFLEPHIRYSFAGLGVLLLSWLCARRWLLADLPQYVGQRTDDETRGHKVWRVARTCASRWRAFLSADVHVWRTLGRWTAMLIVLNVAGEWIWYMANNGLYLASFRNYSVWAICHIAFCLVCFARVVDAWHCHSDAPIRPFTVLVIVVWVSLMQPVTVGRSYDVQQNDITQDWLAHFQKKLDESTGPGPYLLVAASGGGSRAAVFTSLVLNALHHESMLLGNERYRLGDHIVLISAVSGGALGSAHYHAHPGSAGDTVELRNSAPEDVRIKTEREIVDYLEYLRGLDAEKIDQQIGIQPGDDVGTVQDKLKARAKNVLQPRAAERQNEELVGDPGDEGLAGVFLTRAFDDMTTDFMAPLLRGAIHPAIERGDSVRTFWAGEFGLGGDHAAVAQDGSEEPQEQTAESEKDPMSPLLMLNTCSIDRGGPFVIGIPPLPQPLLSSVDFDAIHQATLGEFRTLHGLRPDWSVSVAEAVRLSSNFPWGFAVSSIPRPERQAEEQENAETVSVNDPQAILLTDGGVFDNTGIGAIRALLEGLERMARTETGADGPAAKALGRLRERGVILVEIDSGAKPEPPTASRPLEAVFAPFRALGNASYATAAKAKADHYRRIRSLLLPTAGDEIEDSAQTPADGDGAAAQAADVAFLCNDQDNVMTAWALGPKDKATILARFLTRVQEGLSKTKRVASLHAGRFRTRELLTQVTNEIEEINVEDNGQDMKKLEQLIMSLKKESKLREAELSLYRADTAAQWRLEQGAPAEELTLQLQSAAKRIQAGVEELNSQQGQVNDQLDDLVRAYKIDSLVGKRVLFLDVGELTKKLAAE